MRILYALIIRLYGLAIRIAALTSGKAKQWIEGRQDLFDDLEKAIGSKEQWIWFHAASLGEFEQGRPLIEMLRSRQPNFKILLTFFSPSGYLVRKDYPGADYVTYMPLDTSSNAKRFVSIVQPVLAVFIRYEIWYHHLKALETERIPTCIISAHFRKGQFYFTLFGKFLRDRMHHLTRIFTQTEECATFLLSRHFKNVVHAGDTRLDRVLSIASAPRDFSWLKACFGDGPVVVAGSTWPEDERNLLPAVRDSGVSLIIAPHEINENRLKEIQGQLPGIHRMSMLRNSPASDLKYMLVDTLGDLAYLYALGDLAYVGGGFGKGIHNILEPVAHRIPVIIGPRYHKFPEAVFLESSGVVISVRNMEETKHAIRKFTDEKASVHIRAIIDDYIRGQKGATERIYGELKEYLAG